jgi:tripartite-type tricarboxylate transporter receptor subunit TctC
MLPLSAKIPFNWRELTPVAVTAMDEFVLWTSATLPYKNTKEFVDAAKKAEPQFKMGGTGSKREDHVLTVFMEKKTGAKFAYLPYKSGGEAGDPAGRQPHRGQREQPLGEPRGVARGPGAAALPLLEGTHPVQGQGRGRDVVERHPDLSRAGPGHHLPDAAGLLPAGKVDAEAQAFYVDLMKKITQTTEFKEYMEKQALEARVPHRRRDGEVPRAG